ncbi:hypothetical protein ACS5PN_22525 [Roseateles sp. NT4]|uniref:hypothetical protein n=1 Tax=Roseateles sp. NT4 TaxID=3453715 RepID=UPI003EEEC254
MNRILSRFALAAIAGFAGSAALAGDLSDNPMNRFAGKINEILTGTNTAIHRGMQAFDKATLVVKVEGTDGHFVLQAFNGTRQEYRITADDVDYVYRAGLAEAATKACGSGSYGWVESSPRDDFVWKQWLARNTMSVDEVATNPRAQALIASPGPEASLVWRVDCGQGFGWRYPGDRAMAMPIANYVNFIKTRYDGMRPLPAAAPLTVYVPSSELLQKVYGMDTHTKRGHMEIFQQRLLGASVVARLLQSHVEARVVEYGDPDEFDGKDGLIVTAKPFAFALVTPVGRRDWNPRQQWSQYMRVPLESYGNSVLAFGDAGATFAATAR